MEKRGISDVVTTMLIILLGIASVAILWFVAQAFIFDSAEQIDIGAFSTSFSIPANSVEINDEIKFARLNIKRDSGEDDVIGMNVILEDDKGESKAFPQDYKDQKFNLFETKKVEISYLKENLGKIKRISLAPVILKKDGKEARGYPSLGHVMKGVEKKAAMALWLDFEGNYIDRSNNGNTGSPQGGVSLSDDASTPKRNSKVATFDGVDDYILIGNNPSVNFGVNSFSIVFWAKPEITDTNLRILLDKFNIKGYRLDFINSNGFKIIPTFISDQTISASYTADNNLWRYYAIIFDRAQNKIIVYKAEQASSSSTEITAFSGNPSINSNSIDSSANLVIGKASDFTGNTYKGKLDDMMIFNKALTKEEVDELYKNTKK